MCGHIDPHFQTACHWMTPFYFFIFCSHLMIPIFKMLSHLMSWPPFLEIFIGENGCHALMLSLKLMSWMMPIFTNKWPPRDMYPIFVWKEGFMSLLKDWELTKWPPFFLAFKLKSSLKDPLFFYSPHQMTPYFSFVLTERPHIYSVTERPLLLGSCPHIPVTSICDSPGHWCGPFTNTCKGAWCKYLSQKIFGAPLQTAKKFQGPPFLPWKLRVNPIEKHVNSIFNGKSVVIFLGPPLQGSKILRAPLFASGPPLQVFVNGP